MNREKFKFLKFDPKISPVKVVLAPLLKHKEELNSVAHELYDQLKMRWNISWDVSGAVGKRYRRADEVGTPFSITIDFDTVDKDAGDIIRNKDTTEQIRLPIYEVIPYLSK